MKSSIIIDLTFSDWESLTHRIVLGQQKALGRPSFCSRPMVVSPSIDADPHVNKDQWCVSELPAGYDVAIDHDHEHRCAEHEHEHH